MSKSFSSESGSGLASALPLGASMNPAVELVRLPLRAPPIAVFQRPGQPSAVLSPLDLEQAGFRIREHPHLVPAPFAGAVAPAASSRACHHSIPFDDGLHDLRNGKLAERSRLRQMLGSGSGSGRGTLPETGSAAMGPAAVAELVNVRAEDHDSEAVFDTPDADPQVSIRRVGWPDRDRRSAGHGSGRACHWRAFGCATASGAPMPIRAPWTSRLP